MNLTHTGILGFDADFAVPVVSMTAEDQGQLERFLDRGITPRVRFNVQNTFTNGPVETANVVGEIRGTEHPEQILVVGGHLDSWDLAEGTTDNGSGTATVLGAADAIKRSGENARAERFASCLFTGEEQGLGRLARVHEAAPGGTAESSGRPGAGRGAGSGEGRFSWAGATIWCRCSSRWRTRFPRFRPVKVDDKIEVRHGHAAVFDRRTAGHQHGSGHDGVQLHAPFGGRRVWKRRSRMCWRRTPR